jgi:hypothetical protein
MSLTTLNENEPAGFAAIDKGAGEIRLTRKDTKDSVGMQHWLEGEHRFPDAAVTATAVGQIALSGNRLLYGTGSSWKTSSFNVEGADAGQGMIVTAGLLAAPKIVQFTVVSNYSPFTSWVAGTVVAHRPANAPDPKFNVEIRAGSDADWFRLVASQFTPRFVTSVSTLSDWTPLIVAQYETVDVLTPGMNVWLVAWVEAPATGVSLEFVNNASVVVSGA